MKFTSEDLMKAMGLSVGDRVRFKHTSILSCVTTEYIAKVVECGYGIALELPDTTEMDLYNLLDIDYEILPRPKRVGDTLCKDYECVECHLRCLPHCNQLDSAKKTLFNILDGWNEYDTFDQEIYDLLKTRLDKVVEE